MRLYANNAVFCFVCGFWFNFENGSPLVSKFLITFLKSYDQENFLFHHEMTFFPI